MVTHRSKQEFVRDTVREWIREGKFQPGEQLPPDGELSKQFQLNCRTVAAGLNQLVEEDLLERAPRKGTVVKGKIENPRSNAVALIARDWGDIYSDMARMINQGLMKEHLFPVFLDQNFVYTPAEVITFLDLLISRQKPFGFLAIGYHNFPYEYVKEHAKDLENFVFFFYNHYEEKLPNAKYVLPDYDSMGHQIVRYFAEKKIRNLAFVSKKEKDYHGVHSSTQVQIFLALKKYAPKYDITVDESLFWRCHAGASFKDMLLELEKTPAEMPEGYFALDTVMIDVIYPELLARGITPIKDCPVLGLYNIHRGEKYGFDTFDIRPEETVNQALALLMNKSEEREILIPPVIIRRSEQNNDINKNNN